MAVVNTVVTETSSTEAKDVQSDSPSASLPSYPRSMLQMKGARLGKAGAVIWQVLGGSTPEEGERE